MPVLRTETGHLLIYDPDKSRSTVHTYIAQPTPLEERTLGRLFLLVEIDTKDPLNDDVIRALQEEITGQYYQSADFQMETAFEKALQRLNDRLHQLPIEHFEDWLSHFHIAIAVLKDTTLHFTTVGRMHAFLVHRQSIVDILESSSGAPVEPVNPLKIFTNIVSGQLNLGDSLLFCTTSVLDYLSQEKLKRLLTENDPAETAHALERLLGETDGTAAFGGIAVKLEPVAETDPVPFRPVDLSQPLSPVRPQSSMAELIRREEKTNELLTHSLWPNLGRIVRSGSGYMREAIAGKGSKKSQQELGEERHERPLQPTRQPNRGRTARYAQAAGKTAGKIVLTLGTSIVQLFRMLFRALRPRRIRQNVQGLPTTTNRRLARGARAFVLLTTSRRRLLLVAIILIILFAQSVVVVGRRKDSTEQTATYEQSLRTAQDHVTAADAALLINNESGARRELQSALGELGKIPSDHKAFEDDVAALRGTIGEKLKEIQHTVTVTPELVHDLATLEVGLSARDIAVTETTLYTFSERSSSIYSIDLDELRSDIIVDAPSLEQPLARFLHDRVASLYLLTRDGSLQELNLEDKSLASLPVTYDNVQRDIRDAFFFNNRLYTLDAENGQVFRHQRSGQSFGAGASWITETGLDLHDAVSLAIDGSVYVLKGNGEILKLASGKLEGTTFDPVDPALAQPTMIFTTLDTPTVFVLESAQQRIVEYNKDGGFLRQYSAEDFTDLHDIVVRDNTVYVLNGTQVLRFPVSTQTE